MKFRLYFFSTLILFLKLSITGFSQTTYTVTNVTSGTSNSIDIIIPLAVTAANTGQNVTIYFNASGLCNIGASLPGISTTSGSIKFMKSPLASVDQGLTATSSSVYGIDIGGSSASYSLNKIYVENLNFENFSAAVRTGFTSTLSVNTCTFTNNNFSVYQYGEAFRDTRVLNSIFKITSAYTGAVDGSFIWTIAHQYDGAANGYPGAPGTVNNTLISGNLFTAASTLSLTSKFTAIYVMHQNEAYGQFINSAFSILNNTVTNTYNGFYLADDVKNSNANPENMSSYDIENNNLTNYNYNVFFLNPHYSKIVKNNKFYLNPIIDQQLIQSKVWDIENNSSNIVLSSIALDGEGGGTQAMPAGIKFIDSNTLGYTIENEGNEFKTLNNTYQSTSFYITGNFDRGVYIIGQDLEAEIKVDTSFYTFGSTHLKSFYTHIRQNSIKSNNTNSKPIELIRSGNDYLQNPDILFANKSGSNLLVSYDLGNNPTLHQPGVVDFYETNSNGDLLGYIGYVNQSDISSSSSFSHIFNVTAFPTLNRIAATITTFGVMGIDSTYSYWKDDNTGESGYKWIVFPVILEQQLGTSEAYYMELRDTTCCTRLNLTGTNVLSTIGCDASIDRFGHVTYYCHEVSTVGITDAGLRDTISVCAGKNFSLTVNNCLNTDLVYTWNFGDGTSVVTSSVITVAHSYTASGNYTLHVSVSSLEHFCDSSFLTLKVVVVDCPPCEYSFGFAQKGPYCPETDITMIINADYGCGGDGTTYSWNFGDGQTASGGSPLNHQYAVNGTYTVQLTISQVGLADIVLTRTITIGGCIPRWICTDASIFIPEGIHCINTVVNMSASDCCNPTAVYNWSFGDGLTVTGNSVSHSYSAPGTYIIVLTIVQAGYPDVVKTATIFIGDCIETTCKDCIGSFQPSPGNYVVSLWVREDLSPLPQTYNNAKVEISFLTSTGYVGPITVGTNSAKNKIIDGWQRIEEVFTIPVNATDLKLKLVNNSTGSVDAYFDDIRIFPVDGQMKTYVYDPISFRLTATLDENNYATFYEYDDEGMLIRVKKETEKGVMTIQESREGNKKK